MVGTDPAGQGGIAAVVSVYQQHGFLNRWQVRYLPSHREGGWVRSFLVSAMQLFWGLLTGRVSLLHAHVASNGSFARKSLLLLLARIFGVQTLLHLHGGGFQMFYAASPPWRQAWIRHTLRRSSLVLALSDTWREFLLGIESEVRVTVLPNPVNFPARVSRKGEVLGRVLFLGRADRNKGIFDLLTALCEARAALPLLHLRVGGDGDLDAVRAAIARDGLQDAVTLLGWVRDEDKERELQQAEVFVLPSYGEGLPMALLESMARAKAIITTPVGGIPQALRDGVDGLLVPPGKVSVLAKALVRLHADGPLRACLGDNARERVRTNFATEQVVGRLDAIYRELGLTPTES